MYTITTKKYGDQVLPPLLYEAWQKANFQKNRYAFLWANCREDVLVVLDWVQYGAKDVKDKALLLISLLSKSKFAKFTDNARKWLSEKKTQVKTVAKKIVKAIIPEPEESCAPKPIKNFVLTPEMIESLACVESWGRHD